MVMKRLLIGLLVMMFLVTACSSTSVDKDMYELSEDELYVYLANKEKSELVAHRITVDMSDLAKQISSVVRVLKDGVGELGYQPTIPAYLDVESINLEGENVIIYTGQGFDGMDQVDFILCRSSIIKSLTAIEGVDSIEFYVDGIPMKDANGKVYGPFYDEDVVTASMNTVSSALTNNVILYFPDQQGASLVRVDRQITLENTESLEERIIDELKLVPKGFGLTSVMPDESVLKSIEVSDGVCYIDFNSAFQTKHYGGATGELMTVYAIVNSLTELPNISRVQFLIEGEKTDTYKGHLDFASLFENDITLVNTEVRYEE